MKTKYTSLLLITWIIAATLIAVQFKDPTNLQIPTDALADKNHEYWQQVEEFNSKLIASLK